MSPKFVIFNNFGDTLYTVFIYFRPYFLLFPVHPNHQLIDAPNHRYYENGHACQQPEEDKIVIQVVFPGVIAEDSENYQRHLVQQMVLDGEPLHARDESGEMAVGLLLYILAGLVCK